MKTLRVTFIGVIFSLLNCPLLYGQEDYNVILPPSPTAAALGEYGEVPVSYYTGTPNISIPLWNIKGNELELPISLSYMSNGVRVEEKASWVGLGWSLNAGGVITRTVRGLEDTGGFERVSLPLPEGLQERKDVLVSIQGGFTDPEPDLYNFNFNGYSGTFVLDENGVGNATLVNYEDIDIKLDLNPTTKFTITVENGTEYIFTKSENTIYYGANTSGAASAWYLTTIISATGKEVINFTYADESYQYYSFKRYNKYIRPNGTSHIVGREDPGIFGRNVINGYRLESITTNFGQNVDFIPEDEARQDLLTNGAGSGSDPKALKEIKISDDLGNPLKYFVFQTETVETSVPYTQKSAEDLAVGPETAYSNYRLYLNSVQEFDGTKTESKPPYSFTYFGRNVNDKDLLPSQLSAAQDHWGYYNGQNGNVDLWPGYDGPFGLFDSKLNVEVNCQEPFEVISKTTFNVQGANREPKHPQMKYGTLKKIQYPTGGYTTFDFGAHKYLYETEDGGVITKKQTFGAQVYINYDEQVFERSEPVEITHFDTEFAFELLLTCESGICDFENSLGGCWDPTDGDQAACTSSMFDKYGESSVSLLNSDGEEVIAVKWLSGGFRILKNGLVDPDIPKLMPDDAGYIEMTFSDLYFPPDTYTLKVTKDPDSDTDIIGWFNYYKDVEVDVSDETNALVAGGLRIERIDNYDSNDEPLNSKTYQYSMGVLLSTPRYATYVFMPHDNVSWIQTCTSASAPVDDFPYLEIGCGPHNQLGYTKGASIGYSKVTENLLGNGRIEYEYTTGIEYPDNDYSNPDIISYFFFNGTVEDFDITGFEINNPAWPFFPQDNLDRKRGFLEKVTYKNNEGENVKIVKNTPVIEDFNTIKGVRVQTLRPDLDWLYSIYDHSTGFVNISKTDEMIYDSNNSSYITKSTNYFYEGVNHKLLSKKVFAYNANGQEKTIETRYQYPMDYSSPAQPVYQLVSNHIISPVVEQSVWVNGVLTSGKAINFDYDITNDLVLPATVKLIETTGGVTSDITSSDGENFNSLYHDRAYYKYDDLGNVTEQTSLNGITSSFIWAYNNHFPVIKADNLDHTSLENVVDISLGLHSGAYSNLEDLIDDIGDLNTALSKSKWKEFVDLLISQINDPSVLISAYTYHLLFGITSVTDASGITTYYEYDTFGRLYQLKDHEGNILEEYTYNYKN